jgi:hypothetical protein
MLSLHWLARDFFLGASRGGGGRRRHRDDNLRQHSRLCVGGGRRHRDDDLGRHRLRAGGGRRHRDDDLGCHWWRRTTHGYDDGNEEIILTQAGLFIAEGF